GTGDTIAADLIVVGTGVAPDDRLAKAADLATQDGIIVDDHARTSEAAIFAAGDCTRFPGPHGPVRLENWRHAQEHGAIAGRNAAGGDVVYKVAPSFWSEQNACISKAWVGRSRVRARACAARSTRVPCSCSSSTALASRTRWESMRSGTWRWRGG